MRVLYMSGYTDDAVVRAGLQASTLAFLQKPITPEMLVRKVREVLDGAPAPVIAVPEPTGSLQSPSSPSSSPTRSRP